MTASTAASGRGPSGATSCSRGPELLGDPADLGSNGPGEWERRLLYADEVAL